MCGIFGYLGSKNSIKACLNGLKLLEYRGYDSAGIAAIKKGKLIQFKASGKINQLEKKINIKDSKLNIAIGHTRWATHGPAIEKNAHPHFDEKNSVAIVHNGIIENYDILKKSLILKQTKFRSQTDSEVIAQLFSINYKKDLAKAAIETLKKLKGSLALVIIHKDHPDEIIAAKRESALAIGFDDRKTEFIISSDPNAFSGRNLNVIFLKNNEIVHIKNNELKIFDLENKEIFKKSQKFISKNLTFSKKGFDHYLLKEIFDQPVTIQKAFIDRVTDNNEIEFENFLDQKFLKNIDNIIITACGTSYHASLIAKTILEEKTNIFISTEIASEMRFKNLKFTKNTLVIAISQSGETADTIAAIKSVKEKKAKTLGIVNVKNSTISRICDSSLFLKAGVELSVCSTKAFSSQITVLYLFAIYLARLKNADKKDTISFLNKLKKIPKKVKRTLKDFDIINEKAKKYAKYENFFFLGRNLMYPTAMEAALKLKEISYLNANAYPAGEMKHGPLALIDSKLAVIAFLANKKTYDKMLSNLMEAKARNAQILAFATKKSYGIKDIADDVIWLEDTIDELAIFPSTVAAQLFAYFVAKIRKTDIDHPRNLAKSVTVE